MVNIIETEGRITQSNCVQCGRGFRCRTTEARGIGEDAGFFDTAVPVYCAVCKDMTEKETNKFYAKTKTKYDYI